jgi:hypothetical protein
MTDESVSEGRAAWARIREAGRRSWGDWMAVARALAHGRAEAMQAAKSNIPMGTRYNRLFGEWLRKCGFDEIDGQQRYSALICLENLPAIETWRATLPEKKRDRLNHPNANLAHWRRATRAEPVRAPAKSANGHAGGRPVYFSQDMVRRAGIAIGESRSGDIFTLARRALEAAIRSQDDIDELLGARREIRRGNGAVTDHAFSAGGF